MTLTIPPEAKFVADRHFWWWTDSASGVEVNIAGDSEGPSQKKLDFAARALAELPTLMQTAADYIHNTIAYPLPPVAEWELRWLSSGVAEWAEADESEISFTADSEYIVWSVRFVWASFERKFTPIALSHRQW